VGTTGQLEVVVEAVLDGRPDGEPGAGPELEDGLGQDVGRRVTKDLPSLGAGAGDDGHLGAVG